MKSKRHKFLRSQAWSLDIMLAIVIFIGTIFMFYIILNPTQAGNVGELRDEAAIVLKDIQSDDPDLGIIDGAIVNETKLQELLGKDYATIKSKLRIKNDFCIYFEDKSGNIVYIDATHTGVGSDTITVSNISCG